MICGTGTSNRYKLLVTTVEISVLKILKITARDKDSPSAIMRFPNTIAISARSNVKSHINWTININKNVKIPK